MSEPEQNLNPNIDKNSLAESNLQENLMTDILEDLEIKEEEKTENQLTKSPINLEEKLPLKKGKLPTITEKNSIKSLTEDIANLQRQKESLSNEIKTLSEQQNLLLSKQQNIEINIAKMVEEGVKELESKKQNLEIAVQKLERRQERIQEEMRTNFAGVSQDLAIRIQGFKDYLVGSLQDLAAAAEQLELPTSSVQKWETAEKPQPQGKETTTNPQFAERSFKEETRQIRSLLDQYRAKPDYYGPPWQLRRTFEPIHAERVANWFFSQGGRGAIRSMGSRLQNILIASSIMSILYNLYGDRSRTLVLANTPERLGEWRRGLQDCLGISRTDFGPEKGVVLFENPEALSQKADRLIEEKDLPFIIMDQTDDQVSLSLLQFPLWLAFASEQPPQSSNYFY